MGGNWHRRELPGRELAQAGITRAGIVTGGKTLGGISHPGKPRPGKRPPGNRHPHLQICVIASCRTPVVITFIASLHPMITILLCTRFFLVSVHCLIFGCKAKCAIFTLRSIDAHVKMRNLDVMCKLRRCGRDMFLSHFRKER